MTTLPAVVTIVDLPAATTITGAELFEAVQTVNGVALSVQVPLTAIASAIVPAGGSPGQFLQKLGTTDYSSAWANLGSSVAGTFGITITGSTTVTISIATAGVASWQIATNAVGNVQFRQGGALSLVGVAGNATANVADIAVGTTGGANWLLQVNSGGTGITWGPLSTSMLPGPFQTSSFTAFGVVYGNGTSTLGATAPGTTAWPLVGNGSALAPSFQVLTVPGGGVGTTTLTRFGVVYGQGTSTVGITAAGATALPLVATGTGTAPEFSVLTVPGGGTGTATLSSFALLYGSGTATIGLIAATAAGMMLQSQGTNAPPAWSSGGAGSVTSVATGWGLTGGTITTAGTLSIGTTNPPYGFDQPVNLQINASTSGSALTISIVGNNGTTPSAANPVLIPFRSSSLTSGAVAWRNVTAALSLTIPQTATLQGASGSPLRGWVTAHDTGTAPVLGVINCVVGIPTPTQIFPLAPHTLQTTVAISTTAVTAGIFYSSVALSAVPFTILGFFEYSNMTTAGQWINTPTAIQLFGPGIKKPGEVVQTIINLKRDSFSSTVSTTTPTIITGMTSTVAPTSACNIVRIHGQYCGATDSGANAAIFQLLRGTLNINGGTGASGSQVSSVGAFLRQTDTISNLVNALDQYDFPGSTTSTTYSLAFVLQGGAIYINRPQNFTTVSVGIGPTSSTLHLDELMG